MLLPRRSRGGGTGSRCTLFSLLPYVECFQAARALPSHELWGRQKVAEMLLRERG